MSSPCTRFQLQLEEKGDDQDAKKKKKKKLIASAKKGVNLVKVLEFLPNIHEYVQAPAEQAQAQCQTNIMMHITTITIWQKRGGTNDNLFSNSVV